MAIVEIDSSRAVRTSVCYMTLPGPAQGRRGNCAHDTMRRTAWEIFFHFISIWPFRATATNGLYQAWRVELHGITKVCTDPSVRHYKGVH